MNFAALLKAADVLVAIREAAKRFMAANEPPRTASTLATAEPGGQGQIEARLAGVVVAALKEAFDRDHARLELERAHLDEARRRADAALQQELRRQAVDRELTRLRLLAAASMVGWLASVGMVATGLAGLSILSRVVLVLGWLLLLAALGAAFMAQSAGASVPSRAGTASLWLLLAGLAATAVSVLW